MSRQSWEEALIAAEIAGTTLASSTTPTSIIPAAAKLSLPANYFDVGKVIRVSAVGQLGNLVTTPGTLTLDLRFGGTAVFSSGAMQMSSTAHTTLPFWFEALLTCRAIGAAATLMGQGRCISQALSLTAVADSATTPAELLAPNTTPAVGTSFDSTASQQVDLFATFSISNAANAITLQQFIFEALN